MRVAYESWKPELKAAQTTLKVIEICEEYAADGHSMTLRQVYYQMVARGYIENSQRSYKNLGTLVNKARLAGMIDWDHIVDRTRNLVKRSRWENAPHAIESIAGQFHIDLWRDQPVRVEIWVEKEALAAVIERTAHRFDAPHFACKGYVSQSEMWAAAQRIRRYINAGQRCVILHLGDHDPSGIDMTRDIDERLTDFLHTDLANEHRLWGGDDSTCSQKDIARWFTTTHDRLYSHSHTGIPLEVRRIALTMDQIEEHEPPPNPAKLTDSRARQYISDYGHESWELDALDPRTLDELISDHIDRELDQYAFAVAQDRKERMRDALTDLAERPWAEVLEFLEGS